MSTAPPIKRHPALQPLSREHMSGLIQARNLVNAAAASPQSRRETLARFIEVWKTEIAAHFDDEERLLGPLLSGESLQRLNDEHRELRTLAGAAVAQAAATEPDPELLRRLGMLLNDHIRWEEREAFGEAERAAAPHDLEALQRHAAEIERVRPGSRPRLRL